MRLIAVLLILLFLSFGCATTETGPGILFTSVKEAKMATEYSRSKKTGRACSYSILSLVAVGDSSLNAAKKAGKIRKVSSVDRESFSVLSLFNQNCTIVMGN